MILKSKSYSRLFIVFISVLLFSSIHTGEASAEYEIKGGSIGTASVGGTFYIVGGVWSNIISNQLNFPVAVEVTAGPTANIKLIEDKQLEFGILTMPAAYDGWVGEGWADRKFQNFRLSAPITIGYNQWWSLKGSGIKSIEDLEGKTVNLGPRGVTPDVYGRQILKMINVKPKKIVNSGYSDLVGQLLDGVIDAGFSTGGVPLPGITETEATRDVNIFTEGKYIDRLVKNLPAFFVNEINNNAYKALNKNIKCLSQVSIVVMHKNISDTLAYDITKAYWENIDKFAEVYKPTTEMKKEYVLESPIPLHIGAIRYYREKGLNIPERLNID